MPAITDRSQKTPLLKTKRLNHGTLHCTDIAKTRRFYEEVLGLEVIQTSPISLMVRKGTDHVYAVVETPSTGKGMDMLNHNGFEVDTAEEVEAAHRQISEIKDLWGLKKVNPPQTVHGDSAFYFVDFDGNWWEIVSVRKGGYVADFGDQDWDMTGRHELDQELATNPRGLHMHNPAVRAMVNGRRART